MSSLIQENKMLKAWF